MRLIHVAQVEKHLMAAENEGDFNGFPESTETNRPMTAGKRQIR